MLVKGAADVAARASGLITFPVVAHYVGADGYGAFTQVATVVGVIIPIASLGIGSSMARFFATHPTDGTLARRLLAIGVVVSLLSLLFSAVVFLLAPALNDAFLGYSLGAELFRWGSLLVFTGSLEVWILDVLRSRDWLIVYSGVQFGQTAALVVATVVLLTNGYGVVELMIATVVAKGAAVLWAMAVVARRGLRAPAATAELEAMPTYRRMIRFGLPLTIASLGLWMVQLSDRLVVGGKLGAAAVGRYGLVYNLALLLVMGTSALYLPAYTRLVRSTATGDRGLVEADIRLFHRYLALVTVPIAVYLAVVIAPAVRFLGGPQFHVSVLIVLPIVLAIFVSQWNGLAHYVLTVNDRTPLQQNLWLFAGLLNIGLCLVLVPTMGLEGASLATLASFAVIESIMFSQARRHADIVAAYRWATTARLGVAAAGAAAAAIALLELLPQGGVTLVLATIVFFAVFLPLAVAVREIGRNEFDLLVRTIRPRVAA